MAKKDNEALNSNNYLFDVCNFFLGLNLTPIVLNVFYSV